MNERLRGPDICSKHGSRGFSLAKDLLVWCRGTLFVHRDCIVETCAEKLGGWLLTSLFKPKRDYTERLKACSAMVCIHRGSDVVLYRKVISIYTKYWPIAREKWSFSSVTRDLFHIEHFTQNFAP